MVSILGFLIAVIVVTIIIFISGSYTLIVTSIIYYIFALIVILWLSINNRMCDININFIKITEIEIIVYTYLFFGMEIIVNYFKTLNKEIKLSKYDFEPKNFDCIEIFCYLLVLILIIIYNIIYYFTTKYLQIN